MASKKYYAVLNGRKIGIFTTWKECEEQVKGFSGAVYKSFKTKQEAEEAFEFSEVNLSETVKLKEIKIWNNSTVDRSAPRHSRDRKSIDGLYQPPYNSLGEPRTDSICVDASCLGNPGNVEYQGVDTATGEVIFHKKPMSNGTNNLGEFLAIVHALAYLKNQHRDIPIYSDSETAILWVKNKKVKTTLKRTTSNQEIFELTGRAIEWLEANNYSNPILKWNTRAWGEIPADFGRK